MDKYFIKNILIIFSVVLILIVFTYINQNVIKTKQYGFDDLYTNELAKRIADNDIEGINYDFLNKDLNNIDDILKEQVSLDLDKIRKTKYYSAAEGIYTEKINEIVRILNDKLDDEDFYRLELDLDEFNKNIDFAISDLSNTLDSNIEFELYKNKYLYEEKQKKCRDILETYKGFLQ